jgi:hypothetical protein
VNRRTVLATFAQEEDLRAAVRTSRHHGWAIADIYSPYALHGLEEVLGWPRSRLPVACFLCGAAGAALALWFQFWTSAWDWPLNVGGRPWNSLPAFVPVIFESMVLLGGFGLVFAWLFRCRLYPGKKATVPTAGLTDDRFALVLCAPGPAPEAQAMRQLLCDCHAVSQEERSEEGQP